MLGSGRCTVMILAFTLQSEWGNYILFCDLRINLFYNSFILLRGNNGISYLKDP